MADVEFEPFDNSNLKRIGTGKNADDDTVEKRAVNQNKLKPRNYTIIVLIIIAIVAILSYRFYQNTVNYPSKTKSELQEIRSAIYLYKESFDAYPTQLTELTKSRPLRESWLTDAWGNPYRYEVDENKESFIIASSGYDGKFGTEDDIQARE